MARRTASRSSQSAAKATFSLISDAKFRQIYAAMVKLRAEREKKARPTNIEALLAGASVDLQAGDLIFAEAGLFSSSASGVERIAGNDSATPIYAFARKDDRLLSTSCGAALGLRAAGGDGVAVVFCNAERQGGAAWRSVFKDVARLRLPMLFVLMPGRAENERAQAKVSAEAMDAGVIAVPVDEADAVAVYRVAFESLARARRRTGATVIVATRFVVEGESHEASDDPVARMKAYLKSRGISLSGNKR